MAVPTVALSSPKLAYAPGELIEVTVDHADTDRATLVVTSVVTDSTGASGTGSLTIEVDQGRVTISSTPAKTWTLKSATAGRSVYTTTA